MNSTLIPQYVYWYARRIRQWLGLTGVIGAIAMLALFLFYYGVQLPAQEALAQNQTLLHEKIVQATQHPQQQTQPQQSEAELVEKFFARLPTGEALPTQLKQLSEAAKANKLHLDTGDYKLVSEKQGRVTQYHIQLPLTGEYTQIRGFIRQAMQENAALALSDITLKRENSEAKMVDATVDFVLFLKGQAWQ